MFRSAQKLCLFTSLAALLLGACGGVSDAPNAESEGRQLAVATSTVELTAIQDARTQAASGDVNFSSGILWINTEASHFSFVEFDTSVLPAGAQIESAELVLYFHGNYDGERTVELGRVEGSWDEATLTWNNQPAITWGGSQAGVGDDASDIRWDATEIVKAWLTGARPNEGLALRGVGNGPGKIFSSKDMGEEHPPRLIITYSLPPDLSDAHPDLGDAPDSTNHHGIVNTAYVGVPGQFPTVWNMAGQVAGPRHANRTLEGLLGNFISRENEADLGPDQDGPNNILRNAAGAVGDVANMDNADDGWRNRGIRFFDCQEQTLTVRVSKPAAATRNTMYLNVWFDGTRDGDWADTAACVPPSGGPAQASYEWIVQNYIVDMTSIAAGGFLDFSVDTERVLNVTQGLPHWMRFMLSEEPAVQPPAGGLPDGRGPHPSSPLGSYQFGETEDVFQIPPPPPQPGDLFLEKRVLEAGDTVPQGGVVRYQIKLRHEGGTAPMPASIEDLLPLPVAELHLVSVPGVTSPTGGATPLLANLFMDNGSHGVRWNGVLEPNSEVNLDFRVHVHPSCLAFQAYKTITNVAEAQGNGQQVSANADMRADCPGEIVIGTTANPHRHRSPAPVRSVTEARHKPPCPASGARAPSSEMVTGRVSIWPDPAVRRASLS